MTETTADAARAGVEEPHEAHGRPTAVTVREDRAVGRQQPLMRTARPEPPVARAATRLAARATRLELVTPRIDSLSRCVCGRAVVWDEVYGWLHTVNSGPGPRPAHHVPVPADADCVGGIYR